MNRNGREETKSGAGRPRMPRRGLLILLGSLVACALLSWWLWTSYRVMFFFVFIPLVFVGGPLLRRAGAPPPARRPDGPGGEGDRTGPGAGERAPGEEEDR